METKPHLYLASLSNKSPEEQFQLVVNLYRKLTGKEPSEAELASLRAKYEARAASKAPPTL